jgi:ERCC4-type nuclease
LINQLDIADGLKELLLNSSFTPKSLLNASVSELTKILSIDEYVAKLVSDAINKVIKRSTEYYTIHSEQSEAGL